MLVRMHEGLNHIPSLTHDRGAFFPPSIPAPGRSFCHRLIIQTPSHLSHCSLGCQEVSDLHLDHIRKLRSRIEMSGGCSGSGSEKAVIGKIFAAPSSFRSS